MHQHRPERRRDRPRADRDALPARRRHRPADALLRSGGRRASATSTSTGTATASRSACRARTFRSTRASPCWRRSSTCSMSSAASRRRSAKCAQRSGTWFDPALVDGLRARRRVDRISGPCCGPTICQAAIFALAPAQRVDDRRRGLSRRHRRRLRPGHRRQEPLHQRPQRARRALHRHDRRGDRASTGSPALAEARGAAARHRQARRLQPRYSTSPAGGNIAPTWRRHARLRASAPGPPASCYPLTPGDLLAAGTGFAAAGVWHYCAGYLALEPRLAAPDGPTQHDPATAPTAPTAVSSPQAAAPAGAWQGGQKPAAIGRISVERSGAR